MKRTRFWLLVVALVLLALGGCAIYKRTLSNAKEQLLIENLRSMRQVIQQYTRDKHKAPQSLQDLVAAGYYRQLPIDPLTKSDSTWNPVVGTVVVLSGRTDHGIVDVHSGSTSLSSKGTSYQTW